MDPAKYARVVFVTGPARSGTTLVNRLISGGAHHRTFPECNIISGVVRAFAQALEKRAEAGRNERLRTAYRDAVNALFGRMLRDSTVHDYLVLKDPWLVTLIDALSALLPEARVVICVRDPIDSLASLKAVYERARRPFNITDEVHTLHDSYNALLRTRSIDPKIPTARRPILLSYERLCADPANSVRNLENALETHIEPSLDAYPGACDNPFFTPISAGGIAPSSVGGGRARLNHSELALGVREFATITAQINKLSFIN